MPKINKSTITIGFLPDDDRNGENPSAPRHFSVHDAEKRHGIRFPFTLAAPSFVLRAGVAENARILSKLVPEIGLLFFEGEACLAYTETDLPPDMAELNVSWHVHLPLDLPWHQGMDAVWSVLARLMDKVAYLGPRAWVLHPPVEPGQLTALAERLRVRGVASADILLENVEESDLCACWDEARAAGFSTCLDLGHILAYGQQDVLALPGLAETVRMAHIYGPEGSRHRSLALLDEAGRHLLRHILETFSPGTVVVEIFNEAEFFESIELLAKWLARWETPE
ncbi:cobamide remodeling phosphodiesterase CbiR [Pseudodesulfovibrio sp.]|uniref:cobamide remodeling phosphodiesterase CbiR n=1 Tax=unclassified Pseudodesulfovibrio TaxID=2661612 RepID=UPI003AFFEEB1